MKPRDVAIKGIGPVSAQGTDAASVWNRLNGEIAETTGKLKGELEFTVNLPASRLRRVGRYSRLALAGALEAWKDAGIELDGISPFRRGSIFTTGYGSLVSNVTFSESVAKGDPNSCSPTLFAGTVANSCVGHVCMELNLKGVSTVLMGGNIFVYSKLLLDTDKADVIFAGAVEEYSQDLWHSLEKNEVASGVEINEATVVFVLEQVDEGTHDAYCVLGAGASVGLSGFPLITMIDPAMTKRTIKLALRDCVEKNKDKGDIDAVFSSSNGSYFDEVEERAIEEELPRSLIVSGVKGFLGETMGCAFSLNVAAAALCLKNRSIPLSLTRGGSYDADFRNLLVTGFDPAGNYHCLALRRLG
ncbi:MAG: hypothetical protein LBQ42_10815 [Synergistaceae bacterium]|jgi:3-oxoacyl-(acyl-carrier-protein) synthase|nr:hypothetical protein [Synergistaceae bacterium]